MASTSSPPKGVRFAHYAEHITPAAQEDEELTSTEGSPHSDPALITPPDVIYTPLPTKRVTQPLRIPGDILHKSLCRPMPTPIDLTADASQIQALFTPEMYTFAAMSSSPHSLDLVCSRLTWRFTVNTGESRTPLTPAALILGLHDSLTKVVRKGDFLAQSDKRREAINSARERRCGAVPTPVRMIDFLGPMPRLIGFSATEAPNKLKFSVEVEG